MSDHFFITTSSRYRAELVFILIHVSGPMMNVSPALALLLARLLPSISSWDRKIMTSTVFCLLFYCWALHTGCSRASPLETVAANITTISVERVQASHTAGMLRSQAWNRDQNCTSVNPFSKYWHRPLKNPNWSTTNSDILFWHVLTWVASPSASCQ